MTVVSTDLIADAVRVELENCSVPGIRAGVIKLALRLATVCGDYDSRFDSDDFIRKTGYVPQSER
jgi:hypothetical protein